MKKFDNNIEMFDAYLNNKMSDDDKAALERRLDSDPQLMQEFRMHKEFVGCMQDICSQDDKEFGEAIKNISDEEFSRIIGERKNENAPQAEEKPKKRPKHIYLWMSAAAVVLFMVSVGHNFSLNSKLDNMTQAYCNQVKHDFSEVEALPGDTRGGDQEAADFGEAIEMLVNEKAGQGITKLEKLFNNASSLERKNQIGTQLAFAYITKAKDVNKAKRIINELKKTNNGKVPEELKNLYEDLKAL